MQSTNNNARYEELKQLIEETDDKKKRASLLEEFEKEVAKKCVRPVHFAIDEKDVDAEHDFGPFVLSRAGGFMHYATKGGYHVFVSPSYEAMFKTLGMWLDLAVKNKEKGEDEGTLSDISDFLSSILFFNSIVFSNEDFMLRQFDFITDIIKEIADKSEKELSKQDFDANADFENGVKSVDKLKDILEQAEAEQTEKDKQ